MSRNVNPTQGAFTNALHEIYQRAYLYVIIHVEIESYNKAKKTKSALGESKMLKKLHSREKPRRFISGQSVSGSGSFSTELGRLDRV